MEEGKLDRYIARQQQRRHIPVVTRRSDAQQGPAQARSSTFISKEAQLRGRPGMTLAYLSSSSIAVPREPTYPRHNFARRTGILVIGPAPLGPVIYSQKIVPTRRRRLISKGQTNKQNTNYVFPCETCLMTFAVISLVPVPHR